MVSAGELLIVLMPVVPRCLNVRSEPFLRSDEVGGYGRGSLGDGHAEFSSAFKS
jgi:hypothetical protein